jgi:hypothetical protein
LKAAIRPNREGHIFDYFCVVGYPPAAKVEIKASAQARRKEPVILYQYPEDNQLNEQVVHFCFPNGTPLLSCSLSLCHCGTHTSLTIGLSCRSLVQV